MSARRSPPAHPLRSTGTELPAGLLVAAKALFVTSSLQGYVDDLPEPFLPFVRALDGIPQPALVPILLRTVILAAGAALLLNKGVRASSLAIGLAYGFALLSSRGYYLNATFFLVCMFVLIGLYQAPHGERLVRWQFVVMYLGSVVNKLFEADWRSGQYFEHWMHDVIGSRSYAAAAAVLPPMWLSATMCWTTIAVESILAVTLALPGWRRFGVALALTFHTGSCLLAGTTFGIFYSVLVLSLPVFFDWPRSIAVSYDGSRPSLRAFHRVAAALDADGRFEWHEVVRRAGPLLAADMPAARLTGARALLLWALYSPAFHLSLAAVLALPALWRSSG